MDVYSLAKEYALYTNRCVYITGKAGTGKTTFLRQLRQECGKQMAVVAATGVAAINAEGVTIHSFFQLPPQTFLPTDSARKMLFAEMQMRSAKRNVLRNLELLVIDEISMVRADLLDTIDAVLRHVKHRPTLPFGGVQVILIGDLFQLSPVVREEDWMLLREYYAGPYFFQSHVMQQIQPVYLEFDHIFRQQHADFIRLLNEVRDNTLSADSLALLNSRYIPQYQQDEDNYHIVLSTHNQKVNDMNMRELQKLKAPTYAFMAEVEGTFPESAYPTEDTLTLKEGARVMFIKNDTRPEKAFYNGKLGVVKRVSNKQIIVESEGEEIDVPRATWENVRYTQNAQKETVETEVIGVFAQYPLRLAWAVTIHKAQGLTFDYVVIDAVDAFAAGQVYVALSRCRTLEGIVLLSPLPNKALGGDPTVITYTQGQPTVETMAQQLPTSQRAYLLNVLCGVFDFADAYRLVERLQTIIRGTKILAAQAGTFVQERAEEMAQLRRVGEQFHQQLRTILLAETCDEAFLLQRLQSAQAYFESRVQTFVQAWRDVDVEIDNKEERKNYTEQRAELLGGLSLKLHIMQKVCEHPTLDTYFLARETFVAPSLLTDKRKQQVYTSCQYPELLEVLRQLRRVVADEYDVPAYVPARTATLVEITNTLPTTKKQLMRIANFGKKKYDMWGERLLDVVRTYCQEQDLPFEKEPTKRKKGDSAFLSFSMYMQGKSIREIADERSLSASTIAGHLVTFIREGVMNINDCSTADRTILEEYQERYIHQ